MDDFIGDFMGDGLWEEDLGGANWLSQSQQMLNNVNFDAYGNTPAFAKQMNGGDMFGNYDFLSVTSATTTAAPTKAVEQEQIAQATPVEDASIALTMEVEQVAPVSNQLPNSNAETTEEQRLDSTYFDNVTPTSSEDVGEQSFPDGFFDEVFDTSVADEDGEFEIDSENFVSANSSSIERQEVASVSSDQFASSNPSSIDRREVASGSFNQVAPITSSAIEHHKVAYGSSSSSNQLAPIPNTVNHQQFAPAASTQFTSVASKVVEKIQSTPIAYGFPITNSQAIQAQVASPSSNQHQYTSPASDTFDYQRPVQHYADNGLWEQHSFDFQRQPTTNTAQNACVNTTPSVPQPQVQRTPATSNGRNNLPYTTKSIPARREKGSHYNSRYNTHLPRPEVVRAAPQPQPTAQGPPKPTSTMTSDQLKESLAKVSGSFAMSLLRASLDAPTRTTSQRQLLHVVNMFGVDGNTHVDISPKFRSSLEGIWTMFNTNTAYQKMMLIFVVEKILKQSKFFLSHPELGPLPAYKNEADRIQSRDENLLEMINSLHSGDPHLLSKARELLISETIHRSQSLEASKAISQNTIKQIEAKHQAALKAKQAELDAAMAESQKSIKRMQDMQAETKKMEANMKSMQFKMQQLMNQLSGMQANLTESNQRCQVAHDMNRHLMDSATPEQIAAASVASNASSPANAASQQSFYPNQSVTPPPGNSYYYINQPITPPPSKKRKSSNTPYVGNFYLCLAKKNNEFCGVINNQYMVGGKNDGEYRQRCVASACKKYTDIKDKHWVPDHIAAQYGVGQKAPLNCVQRGGGMVAGVGTGADVQMTPVTAPVWTPSSTPTPTYTSPYLAPPPAHIAPTPTPEQASDPAVDNLEGLGDIQKYLTSSPAPAPAEEPVKYFKNHLIRTAAVGSLTLPAPPTQSFSS
ncbi:hypothetical protein BKA65DRAFT_547857 [Rhexocercosporidium sp. MPI-PUGE-AT-0058]|nr:hypothetical protein BKA65DRAFT_547857 [Rhexocercosporidium sp. MPI-PUGE-AT-0058]